MKALAIDLGGSHATCAIVQDRTILASEEIAAHSGENLSALLARTLDAFGRLEKSRGYRSTTVAALPWASRALFRRTRGGSYPRMLNMRMLRGWTLRRGVARTWVPLRIENDARMALLGEAYAGAASGFTEVVMITLGTGIGGVAMIEGKLLRGKHSQAGCLGGHIPVLFSGRPCTCGGMGCAEAEAGGWSLPLIFEEWPGARASSLAKYPKVGFKELFENADARDRVAVEVRDRCLKVWCATAAAMVHAYDPETIVMGGGVMKSAARIVPIIQSHIEKYAWTPWGKVEVRAAALGNHAALLGQSRCCRILLWADVRFASLSHPHHLDLCAFKWGNHLIGRARICDENVQVRRGTDTPTRDDSKFTVVNHRDLSLRMSPLLS